MNLFEAFLMAAAVAIAYLFSIGEKVIHVDLSGLLPKNSKSAKRRRLLVKCDTPLQGEKQNICHRKYGPFVVRQRNGGSNEYGRK